MRVCSWLTAVFSLCLGFGSNKVQLLAENCRRARACTVPIGSGFCVFAHGWPSLINCSPSFTAVSLRVVQLLRLSTTATPWGW